MRLEIHDNQTHVFLSKRNLLSLLAKLNGHPPDSACTLMYQQKDNSWLIVTGEPDNIHYVNSERDGNTAGPTHPDTEKAIMGIPNAKS